MSHEQIILKHLTKHRGITSVEAFDLYGITRLSATIHRLRHEHKVKIGTIMLQGVNRYGNTVNYARYYLIKTEDNK